MRSGYTFDMLLSAQRFVVFRWKVLAQVHSFLFAMGSKGQPLLPKGFENPFSSLARNPKVLRVTMQFHSYPTSSFSWAMAATKQGIKWDNTWVQILVYTNPQTIVKLATRSFAEHNTGTPLLSHFYQFIHCPKRRFVGSAAGCSIHPVGIGCRGEPQVAGDFRKSQAIREPWQKAAPATASRSVPHPVEEPLVWHCLSRQVGHTRMTVVAPADSEISAFSHRINGFCEGIVTINGSVVFCFTWGRRSQDFGRFHCIYSIYVCVC